MKRFYITGVSGVGKSSVGRVLIEKGYSVIDIDAVKGLCHWVNNDTKEVSDWQPGIGKDWLDKHSWVCDKEKLTELVNQYDNEVFVVGSSTNQNEYLDLFDKIFLLECSSETFFKRIHDRSDNDYGKHESEQESILYWHNSGYQNYLMERGAVKIDTEVPLNEVVNQIVSMC